MGTHEHRRRPADRERREEPDAPVAPGGGPPDPSGGNPEPSGGGPDVDYAPGDPGDIRVFEDE
jgi:hypothetical protein